MKLRPAVLSVVVLWSCGVWGQEQPPGGSAAPSGPPVLEYTGKPVTVTYQCTAEDLQWAGLSCSDDEPCPMYLELTSVLSVGPRIFAAGNIHSSAVTLYSVLLGGEEAGHTWREVHPRIRGAGLDHIQFLDTETGWVSGQIVSPLPQDPFLLVTTDGGKSWRQRPIFSETRESRYGSVLQFFFSSKDSGSAIVDRGQGSDGDRYELYESPDAGESWSIKETSSKVPKLSRVAAPPVDWRLHADNATQSFHIEHRAGERWSSVAAFAVKLGVCKSPAAEAGR